MTNKAKLTIKCRNRQVVHKAYIEAVARQSVSRLRKFLRVSEDIEELAPSEQMVHEQSSKDNNVLGETSALRLKGFKFGGLKKRSAPMLKSSSTLVFNQSSKRDGHDLSLAEQGSLLAKIADGQQGSKINNQPTQDLPVSAENLARYHKSSASDPVVELGNPLVAKLLVTLNGQAKRRESITQLIVSDAVLPAGELTDRSFASEQLAKPLGVKLSAGKPLQLVTPIVGSKKYGFTVRPGIAQNHQTGLSPWPGANKQQATSYPHEMADLVQPPNSAVITRKPIVPPAAILQNHGRTSDFDLRKAVSRIIRDDALAHGIELGDR